MADLIKKVFSKDQSRDRILTESFDYRFYKASNPDVTSEDLLEHYLTIGWKEGRDPAPDFSTNLYLEAYPDVRDANINPYLHYLFHGKSEDRNTFTSARLSIMNNLLDNHDGFQKGQSTKSDGQSHEYDTVSKEFDADYYLKKYSRHIQPGIEPLDYFLSVGWKFEHDPNIWFSTKYYLDYNPDIREAGINPFYHYLVRGRIENRLPKKPGGERLEILEGVVPLKERVPKGLSGMDYFILDAQTITDKIKKHLIDDSNQILIAFGHDNYLENIGGVQILQCYEQDACNQEKINYLQLSPPVFSPVLDSGSPNNCIYNIICNGTILGSGRHSDIIYALNQIKGIDKVRFDLVIHALHGHSTDAIINLHMAMRIQSSYFWTHDYYSLCPGYTLLRNDVVFCNSPPPASGACNICIYGDERRKHLTLLEKLFSKIDFTVISPSQHTYDLWESFTTLDFRNHILNPYCKFKPTLTRIYLSKIVSIDSPLKRTLKIAFIGHEASHKGWPFFCKFYEHLSVDDRYEFIHLGSNPSGKLDIPIRSVSVTMNNKDAMTTAIREENIDVAFIWSIWPETFCMAAYEAMAAGALVITPEVSGNVQAMVSKYDAGYVFENEYELINSFKSRDDGNIFDDIWRRKLNGIPTGKLEFSSMTCKYICQNNALAS